MHGLKGGRWGGNHDPDRDGRETFGPAPDVGTPGRRTSGLPHSIGGCWGGDDHGEPEYAPVRETGGTEPGRPTAARRTSGLPHKSHKSLHRFHQGGDLHTDFGNWFVPTIAGLHGLCRAAGFARIETVLGPPDPPEQEPESLKVRIGRRMADLKRDNVVSAPSARYRAVVHAYV